MNAEDFFDSKAIKYQLRRGLKNDYEYFKDAIVSIMEQYAEQKQRDYKTDMIMIAKVEIKIDVKDFVEDEDLTFPQAEEKIKEMVDEMVNTHIGNTKEIKVEISD